MPTFKLPSGGVLTGSVRVLGKEQVEAKLARAEANILANNRVMVGEMLGFVKAEVMPQIPLGPAHFGYHGRDTLKTVVQAQGPAGGQLGTKVVGFLKGAAQIYWREFGTGMRYRGPKKKAAAVRIMTGRARTGGEPAYLTAHKALAGIRKFINFYYGGQARWWHL